MSKDSKGFTIIEVMVATFVIVIALVSLLALFAYSVATMALTEDLLIGKEKAREALESIFAARTTQQITFDEIQNVAPGQPGIFLSGYQQLKTAGDDGLIGTADDGAIELNQFEREIQIDPVFHADDPTEVDLDVRRVRIRIRFSTPLGGQRIFELESYISRFR
ncbi:MAG TPA: hypothetical protein EYN74_08085 [Nitrospirales bacterium]|nr:hypothetical protein [Nitrospirales bacterium]